MPWSIFFIIAGIVLRANDEWFNGAETVGTVSLWFGIITIAIQLIVFGLAAGLITKARKF